MKLFVAYQNTNKFVNNTIISSIPNLEINYGSCRGNLYRIQQQQKNNSYIFMAEDLDREVLQFIQEYSGKIKIFVYHQKTDNQLIEGIKYCYHLTNECANYENCISMPYLINDKIFTQKRDSLQVTDSVLCFIDNITNIDNITSLLYPNSNINLRIYGPKQNHSQNLGTVSEYDKNILLNKYTHYLDIDGQYIQEALLCGCSVYSTESIVSKENINSKTSINYKTYESFLVSILT